MNKELIPKIRFKGFTEAWEQRKLFEVGNIITGTTPSTSDESNYNGDYLFISPADININRYIEKTNTTLSKKGFESGRILKGGSVLFVSIGSTIGKVAQTKEKSTSNQQINAIEVNENNNNNFIYSLLEKHSNNIKAGASTQAVPILNKTSFSLIELEMPKANEQESIGILFERIDNLITLHQRKCDKLIKIKQSMLEKLFPKNNQNIPDIRFKGFTEAWEQRKFTGFVEFYSGQTYSPSNVQQKGTLVLRSSNVQNGEISKEDLVFIDNKVVNVSNVKKDDIIVVVRNGSRNLIGKHAKIKENMPNTVIGTFMSGIRTNNPNFVNALLNTTIFENEISVNMGATINQITGYMFSNMNFFIPENNEQQKIGMLFDNLDNLITLHQRKYEKLIKIKQSLLNDMFV